MTNENNPHHLNNPQTEKMLDKGREETPQLDQPLDGAVECSIRFVVGSGFERIRFYMPLKLAAELRAKIMAQIGFAVREYGKEVAP